MRDPYFAVVRTDSGWLTRFVAANGKEVWRSTETYRKRINAVAAVELICGASIFETAHNEHPEVHYWQGNLERPTEVREVDERTAVTP